MERLRYAGCILLMVIVVLGIVNAQQGSSDGSEADDPTSPHRNPSKCEVCKIVAIELQGAMEDTGKSREILRLGHDFDKEHKQIPYKFSELRFIETLETICDRVMEYNIHAERKDSRRFAKGRSETFSTLHGLVNKGVKVDLGIPYNMWDEPSAPVHTMRKFCDTIIEGNEEVIEQWFRGSQEKTLTEYLCRERALTNDERECLDEVWTGEEKVEYPSAEDEQKGDTGDDDDASKKAAEADSHKKVQQEIERQSQQQQQKAAGNEKLDKEKERDKKKREREEERRRRSREDKDGDKKMEKERDDRRKVEREMQRQAEREQRNRGKHGKDHHERGRDPRGRDRERERDRYRRHDRFDGMDFDMDPEERMDRYMDDEMEDIRRRYDLDDDDLGGRYRDREKRRREEREERRRRHRNEL